MANLQTTYLGLELKNPLVVSSSSLTGSLENVLAAEAAGAGAVVLKSIFEEQIKLDVAGMYDALSGDMHPEAYEYLTADLPMEMGPSGYVDKLRRMKERLNIPVIASVNCIKPDQWISFARKLEAAGADALELNIYDFPERAAVTAVEIEDRHVELVRRVAAEAHIPVAVKIGPQYTSVPNMVRRFETAGAAGVVMFNRFLQPDINIDALALSFHISYSRSQDLLLPLRWIAMTRPQTTCSLALTTGVHSGDDVVKAILAGADTVQLCSVIYEQGLDCIQCVLTALEDWMERHEMEHLASFRGRLKESTLSADHQGFARAQYIKGLAGLE